MRVLTRIRKHYDHEKIVGLIGRLWSLVGAGIACTLVAFAGVYLFDWLEQHSWKGVFTLIGCLSVCVTLLLGAAFAFLGALDVTICTTRHRFRRIAGAWLLNGPFIAGVLFMGYLIVRGVLLPR